MIEQDNNGMKTPWTELELGNSCYSSYIVEPIFVPKETAFWLCRPDGTREASRLTFAVFSQRGTDEWEDDPMLGPIDVTLLDDDNIRPFPTLYLGVAPEDFIHLEEEDEESVQVQRRRRAEKHVDVVSEAPLVANKPMKDFEGNMIVMIDGECGGGE